MTDNPARQLNVYTIAANLAFTDTLAAGLSQASEGGPLSLANTRILLPTRRSCRSLREAFLRQSGGKPVLLPRMTPIGDVDEDDLLLSAMDGFSGTGQDVLDIPPAIASLHRQLILMGLIGKRSPETSADQAALLAGELAKLIDQVATEQLDFAALEGLVEKDLSEHWQETLKFMQIVTEFWPAILAEKNLLDPASRRNLLIQAQNRAWANNPPQIPIIAAGSTGSIPATAQLLATIASLPTGCVILPGLDRGMDQNAWQALEPTHPQYGLKLLLGQLGVERGDVKDWHTDPTDHTTRTAPQSRIDLLRSALRPASVTGTPVDVTHLASDALSGVSLITCPDTGKEAETIALILRETLDTPGRTAALITPDRNLARRVRSEMKRWNVEVDDSGGTPLSQTPPGTFLRLSAAMIASELAPLSLLGVLKHPLAAGGQDPATFRRKVRQLERDALRGPRPAPGFAGLLDALNDPQGTAKYADSRDFVENLSIMAQPFSQSMADHDLPLAAILRAHIDFAEALAGSDEASGANRLWRGDAGEVLAGFVAELYESLDASNLPTIPPGDYPALFNTLLMGRVVRPRHASHPRLNIWGPMEARLQHADVLILGSLNEAAWPREPAPDPWMSRPMMAAFGLPPPERRIGLSAHDFAQAFCAPRVFLTRSERSDGAPTVPSRWLRRLENLIEETPLSAALKADQYWQRLTLALDHPTDQLHPVQPKPCPPVAARPRQLSVTRVRSLQRDPYAIYARYVLKLKPLDTIDADPGAADRGTIIHNVLEAFIKAYPVDLPDHAEQRLIEIGEQKFSSLISRPGIRAFWWPRFLRVAHWFITNEQIIRQSGQYSAVVESTGTVTFEAPGGPFTLTARADRIDRLGHGKLSIIDYKTGQPPSSRQAKSGLEPQLPLEAAIIRHGHFDGLTRERVDQLAYYWLSGGRHPGKISYLDFDVETVSEDIWQGFQKLVAQYDRDDQPYLCHIRPVKQNDYGDYDHLARFKEWKSVGDEE